MVQQLTVEELTQLKGFVAEQLKENKEAVKVFEKDAKAKNVKEVEKQVSELVKAGTLAYGKKVVLTFKGKAETFDVVGLTEKTIQVKTDAGLRYVKFRQFVKMAE